MKFEQAKTEFERRYWWELASTCRCVAELAKKAGVNRTDCYKKLRRCGLDPEIFRLAFPKWQKGRPKRGRKRILPVLSFEDFKKRNPFTVVSRKRAA